MDSDRKKMGGEERSCFLLLLLDHLPRLFPRFSHIEYYSLTAQNEKEPPPVRGRAFHLPDLLSSSSRQREVPLNNNFDRQIGVVHISAFDRYLAKLWALPAVSRRRGERGGEGSGRRGTKPRGALASRFRLGSTSSFLSILFFSPSLLRRNFPLSPTQPSVVSFQRGVCHVCKNSSTVPLLLLGEQRSLRSIVPEEKNRNCTRQSTTR